MRPSGRSIKVDDAVRGFKLARPHQTADVADVADAWHASVIGEIGVIGGSVGLALEA